VCNLGSLVWLRVGSSRRLLVARASITHHLRIDARFLVTYNHQSVTVLRDRVGRFQPTQLNNHPPTRASRQAFERRPAGCAHSCHPRL
jgi:hypothetical protein